MTPEDSEVAPVQQVYEKMQQWNYSTTKSEYDRTGTQKQVNVYGWALAEKGFIRVTVGSD